MAADSSDRRELPVDGSTEQPAPSPDGTFVAFYAVHDGQSGLWRARPDGSELRLLDKVSAPSFLNVSPDSRWLYYTSATSGRPSTWRVSTDGGHASLVALGLERGIVSPDGTLLAGLYIPVVGGPYSLGVLPVAGGPPVHVFHDYAPPTSSGTLRWAPDGGSLYYTTVERMNVFRQRLSGGAPEKMTPYSDQTLLWFDLTRDGKQFVFARGTQSRDAFLITNFR
jgi:Tol biopolymer transport system component